jgi:hypothetical protein
MTARIRRTSRATGVGLAVVAALATGLLTVSSAGAGAGDGERAVIGEASSNGLRVRVTASRVEQPKGGPPAATVRIAAFERSGGRWRRLGGALTVGEEGGWFWRVVTRPFGVRKLVLARVGGSAHPDRIGLRLLISPSIGPTGTFRFTVQDGKLVAVDV